MQELARDLGLDELPCFTQNRFPDSDLIDAFLRLHRGFEGCAEPVATRQLLIETFARLFGRHGSGGRPAASSSRDAERLRSAIDMMRARHAEALTLGEMAEPLGLSSYQLIELFKQKR